MRRYYPAFLDIEGRKCVIVGGGEVAARKAKALAQAGGLVKVVSPEVCRRVSELAEKGLVELLQRRFRARDLDGAFLAIASTDDRKVNEKVFAAARRKRVLVNVVDSPAQCDFIVPSVVSRGAMSIAISTSGVSPALARMMRQELQKRYGRGYARFLSVMGKARGTIVRKVSDERKRRRIFRALTNSDFVAEFVGKGKDEARLLLEEKVRELLEEGRAKHV